MDKRSKKIIKDTVSERIGELLAESRNSFRAHPERSERYLKLLWKLVQRHKVRLSREQKLSFCKRCFTPWVPGKNIIIHFDQKNSVIEYRCKNCNFKRRLKYK